MSLKRQEGWHSWLRPRERLGIPGVRCHGGWDKHDRQGTVRRCGVPGMKVSVIWTLRDGVERVTKQQSLSCGHEQVLRFTLWGKKSWWSPPEQMEGGDVKVKGGKPWRPGPAWDRWFETKTQDRGVSETQDQVDVADEGKRILKKDASFRF